jgi:hypothetical protein
MLDLFVLVVLLVGLLCGWCVVVGEIWAVGMPPQHPYRLFFTAT